MSFMNASVWHFQWHCDNCVWIDMTMRGILYRQS